MNDLIISEVVEQIPGLRRYAWFLTKEQDKADDLVQTCLERALQRIHQFKPGTNLRAWLFTILRHSHINTIRRDAKWTGSLDATECESLFPAAATQHVRLEMRDFWSAMAQLPEADRSVLSLVGGEGRNYQEAADALDVPIGTVRSRLSRARNRLRSMLAEDAIPQPPANSGPELDRGRAGAGHQHAA